jgi:hypothetical protein
MRSCQCVGAVRAARLRARHAVVETLQEPGLEPTRIGRPGEPLQHRRRLRRPDHRWTVSVHVSGEKRGGAQVIGGCRHWLIDRHVVRREEHVCGLDEGATSVGPADGMRMQERTPPHGCGSVHAARGFEGALG